jgi:thiosulfate reductase / polysulfide reductase chain A
MPRNTVYSVCGMCPVRCPIEVEVEKGQCLFIQGNRHIPSIRGALCTRGGAGIAQLLDEERVQFPMLRKGARGEGRWQRLSWDEALAHAAEKLSSARSAHGGRSILWSDAGGPFSDLRRGLVRALGSPNYFGEDSVHGINRQHAALSLFGMTGDRFAPDFRNADEVVLQGRNLFESIDIRQANDLLDGLENGGRLTVIDIRATVTSSKADRFFLIRPATDYALNMAVIHTLLKQKLYNGSFAERWIKDLDALAPIVEPFTPELAEEETGIKAGEITALAEKLAKAAPRVVWHPGWRTSRYSDSFFVSRTAYIINALLGAVGAKGGMVLASGPEEVGKKGLRSFADLFPPVAEKRVDGAGSKFPAFEFGPGMLHAALGSIESGEPYPGKALVTYQQDPLEELPDSDKVKSLFSGLDFILSITSAWSETSWQADLVLPLSHYLERETIIGQQNGIKPSFLLRKRCVEPRYETRPDWEIVGGLAQRMGFQGLSFGSAQDLWNAQLEGTGVKVQDFDEKGIVELTGRPQYDRFQEGFAFPTDSGKIEMVSPRWEKQGLPSFGPLVKKEKPAQGTYRLTFGGCGLHGGGHTINNPLLHRQMPENVLWMNQAEAKRLGIVEGQMVSLTAKDRTGSIRVRLTEFIHPEAVFMVSGFGRTLPVESRAEGRGLAHNRFMPGGLGVTDPAGGGPALQEHFVTIKKL